MSKKERYATSRLSPLDGGESKATDGDIDAPLLAAMLFCGLSTVSSRQCRQCKPTHRHADMVQLDGWCKQVIEG